MRMQVVNSRGPLSRTGSLSRNSPTLCALALILAVLLVACATDEKAEVLEETWECMANASDPEFFETSMLMMFPSASNLEEAKEQYIYVSQAASLEELKAARDEVCGGVSAQTNPTTAAPQQTAGPTPVATAAQSTAADVPTPTPAEIPAVETLWRHEAENDVLSPTLIADGRVYVSMQYSPLIALDVDTGELLWQETTERGSGTATPIVVDGVVYVGVDGGGGSGYLYALNAETGELLWEYVSLTRVSVTTVSDGVVYVATRDFGIVALDAKSGVLLRSYEFDFLAEYHPFWHTSPAVAGGILYSALDEVGAEWQAFAMDLESGELLWRHEIGTPTSRAPQVDNGTVYVSTWSGSYGEDIIYALDRTSGELLWDFDIGELTVWHEVYGGTVYVRSGGQYSSEDNPLYALDAKTGELLWSYEGGQGYYAHTVSTLLDGILYLGAEDGNLHALDADSGQLLRSYMNVGTVFSVTTGPDGKVRILGSEGTHIYLLAGDAAR